MPSPFRLAKNDAWILMAIGSDGTVQAIQQIITAADYLNKSVPTQGEFERAITDLVRAGYVDVVFEGFKTTPMGATALDEVESAGRGVIDVMMELMELWDGREVVDRHPEFHFHISPEAYEAGEEAYRAWFRGWMERHKREAETKLDT